MKTNLVIFICLIFLKLNGYAQWTLQNANITANLTGVHFLNENSGIIVGSAGTVLITSDGGNTWNAKTCAQEDFKTCWMLAPTTFMVGGEKLYQTINGGLIWNSTDFTTINKIHFADANTGYLVDFNGIYQTTDAGSNWTMVKDAGGTSVCENVMITSNATPIVMGNVGGFITYSAFGYRPDENGIWYPFDPFSFPNSNAYTASYFTDADTGFLFANQFNHWIPSAHNQLIKLTNFELELNQANDLEWFFNSELVNDQMPDLMHDAFFFNSADGYAVSDSGKIYKTSDGGVNWTIDYNGDQPINSLYFVNDHIAYAVGNNGIILKKEIINDVNQPKNIDVSINITPNPAHDYIVIKSKKNIEKINIYDIGGKEVLSSKKAGNTLTSLQLNINTLPKGIYIIKVFSAGDSLYNGKIVVE